MRPLILSSILLALTLVPGCQAPHESPPPAGWADAERLLAADVEPESWLALGLAEGGLTTISDAQAALVADAPSARPAR